jgi:hypothetical protein
MCEESGLHVIKSRVVAMYFVQSNYMYKASNLTGSVAPYIHVPPIH